MHKWLFIAHTAAGEIRFHVRAGDKQQAIFKAFDKLRADHHETAMHWTCTLCL